MTAHPDDSTERADRQFNMESTFESLQNSRRRWTLRYLTDRKGPVAVATLADQITAWEQHVEIGEIGPQARKSVYNSLTQTHLPHLDERGIVVFDQHAGTVELAPNADQYVNYPHRAPTVEDRWGRRLLATSAVAGVLAVANWLGIVADAIAPMTLNAVIVGLFLTVSIGFSVAVQD